MNPVRRVDDGLVVELSDTERMMLGRLATELQPVLRDAHPNHSIESGDPAIARLLPSAYPDDPEAATEFRRYTAGELLDGKLAQQRTIARLFGSDSEASITLSEPDAVTVLRGLTDLRLVLAERLGIREDGDDGMSVSGNEITANVYAWLGYLQGALLEALES